MAAFGQSKAMSITKNVEDEEEQFMIEEPTIAEPYNREFAPGYILLFTYSYIFGVYGLYLCFTSAKWGTIVFTIISMYVSFLGIAVGGHRLFSHKSYKATRPLQVFLMLAQSLGFQRHIFRWVRDHRLHHKYSDTDADPHNRSRGFFFSHIGWLLVKEHPEVVKRKRLIDMSDISGNDVLMFQKRNAQWLLPLIAIVLPTAIPWLLGETFSNSWHLNVFRFIMMTNLSSLINSLSHSWGYKPYDKTMKASQSLPAIVLTLGEGYHNYHHAFPWDYRASELGNTDWNYMTKAIDWFEKVGLAYDLKTASSEMVKDRKRRTGDGTDLWGRKIQNDE